MRTDNYLNKQKIQQEDSFDIFSDDSHEMSFKRVRSTICQSNRIPIRKPMTTLIVRKCELDRFEFTKKKKL